MNQKIKNYLGAASMVSMLAVAYALVQISASYKESNKQSVRSFTVQAEGKAAAIPDVAEFNFSVITQGGKELDALLKENTAKANKAIEFLKQQAIEAQDIATSQFVIEPRYQYVNCKEGPCPPPEIAGYTITQSVSVKIREFGKIGEVLRGVVKNGANAASNLEFTLDDSEEVGNKARKEAIEKAKRKAKSVAAAAGFRIGRLLSVQEGFSWPTPLARLEAKGGFGGDVSAVPAIEPGSQEVTINVTLTYEIK